MIKKLFLIKKLFFASIIALLFVQIFIQKTFAQAENQLTVGFNKFNNTWNFIGNIFYNFDSDWGNLTISNGYQGTASDAISNSFRDDDTIFAAINYSIFENFFVTTEAKYNIISDKTIQDANQLKRFSTVAGISGKPYNFLKFKLLAGGEDNIQAMLKSIGFLTKANAKIENFNIDDYYLNSSLNSELLFLQDKRSSKDVEFLTDIYKNFSQKEMFRFGAKYKLQERNFLQFFNSSEPNSANSFAIETNFDSRIAGNLAGNWQIGKKIVLNFDGNIENISINRNFANNYENINYSKVDRKYNEFITNLKVDIDFSSEKIFQKIGMIFASNSKQNSVKKRFELDDNTFLQMQSLETQKDNNSVTTNLFYSNNINITKNDTIRTNLSIMKVEYNVPSLLNNDTRDEASAISSIWYLRKCSDILTISANLNYSQNHLVFIKKERSSQNNWNRIISLNSGIKIQSNTFFYFPQFEVLANYTAYDFETSAQKPRSYSFRQILYKDSLQFLINEKYHITNKFSVRCYEQGKLFWSSFSELPQMRNIEISAFPMLNFKLNQNVKIGLGGRLFFLEYGVISQNQGMQNTNRIHSISPEASYSIRFSKFSLHCYGWLEFKYQQNKFTGRNPNIFMQTSYNL